MPPAKFAMAIVIAAIGLSACASTTKPLAGSATSPSKPVGRGRIDDPRTSRANRIQCLQQHHLPVTEVGATGLQIGPPPGGPTVQFAPTAGAAQGDQIEAREEGAEVIGAALLYPNQGSDDELSTIEQCLDKGVSG